MPAPKTLKQEKVVRMYVTSVYFTFLNIQAKKRNVSVSQLCKLALFDYFNPRYIQATDALPINRIDRTPRPKDESVKTALVRELKKLNIKDLLKPVGSFDNEIDFEPENS